MKRVKKKHVCNFTRVFGFLPGPEDFHLYVLDLTCIRYINLYLNYSLHNLRAASSFSTLVKKQSPREHLQFQISLCDWFLKLVLTVLPQFAFPFIYFVQ